MVGIVTISISKALVLKLQKQNYLPPFFCNFSFVFFSKFVLNTTECMKDFSLSLNINETWLRKHTKFIHK